MWDSNAPINIFVSFSKKGNQKPIQFTIANPFILDEQYSGPVPAKTPTAPRPPSASPSSTQKEAPFLEAAVALVLIMLVWIWRKNDGNF